MIRRSGTVHRQDHAPVAAASWAQGANCVCFLPRSEVEDHAAKDRLAAIYPNLNWSGPPWANSSPIIET
jgi:hypothetical protein